MSGFFKPPKVEKPAPPPTRDDAAEAQSVQDALRRRRGAAASILTSPRGDLNAPQTAAKKLLGQ